MPVPVLVLVLVVGACGADRDSAQLTDATPPYGPLVGGTRIILGGHGFGAGPHRVLIGGHPAPLVASLDDATLEVVVPPGDAPGDAEILVLGEHGSASARGLFRYSAPPTITAITPAEVLYRSTTTTMTVTGRGFVDEGAGPVAVALDGVGVADVEVIDDTTVRFTAPPGRPLREPTVELVDGRGRAARPRGFRYLPSTRPGLLLFPTSAAFAVFFDPVDGSTVTVPWAVPPGVRFTAVVRDPGGTYWAIDRSRRFGRLDLSSQRLEATIQLLSQFPTMIRVGAAYFALERNGRRFGRFEPATGQFTAIGTAVLPCCGAYGLADVDGTLMITMRQGADVVLSTIDPVTGVLGPPRPITAGPDFHVEELRAFAGTVYATSRDGSLVTIDPATGATTVIPLALDRVHAMEVYDPGPPSP